MLPENFVDEPPSKLVIALQFWQGDHDRAMRLARLIANIEQRRRNDVIFAFCRRFDQPETPLFRADGRQIWGDQSWLEVVGDEFGAHVIRSPAAAPGPWNIHTQPIEDRAGVLHFGDRPLVAFHYSSCRLRDGQLANPEYAVTERQARMIYGPYLAALARAAL